MGLTRRTTSRAARDAVFSVIDVETTGLEPKSGGIVEIGLVKVRGDGTVLDEFATLINRPGSSSEARAIHQIDDMDLIDAPSWAEVWPEVRDFIAGTILVAHNSEFEEKFLAAEVRRHGETLPDIPTLCTLTTARRQLDGKAYSLKSLHKTVSGRWRQDEHTALGDARASAELLLWFLRTAPTPLYLEGEPPTEAPQRPSPSCLTRCRPVDGKALSIARLVAAFPASPAPRPGDADAIAMYEAELREALDDGKLTKDEVATLTSMARRTGLTGPQLEQLHDEAWQQAFADLAEVSSHQRDSAQLRAAEQLGLTTRAADLKDQIDETPATPPSPDALLLRSWRLGFVGTSTEVEDLRRYAADHGVKIAKRITSTVRFTVEDQTTPKSPHLASSYRLGIPVVSPRAAKAQLDAAITKARRDRKKREAQMAKLDAQFKQARDEADAYWRHHWRTREHPKDPGPTRYVDH